MSEDQGTDGVDQDVDQDSEPPLTTPPQQAPADADVDDQDAEPTQNNPDELGPTGHS